MASAKKILSGAAFGTLLGSLSAVLYARRYEILQKLDKRSSNLNHLTEKAREYGESLFNSRKKLRFQKAEDLDKYWKGGLVGLLVGAGAALLVAPKSGKSLRGQLSRAYEDMSEKSEKLIHQFKNNSHAPFSTARNEPTRIKKKKILSRLKQPPTK